MERVLLSTKGNYAIAHPSTVIETDNATRPYTAYVKSVCLFLSSQAIFENNHAKHRMSLNTMLLSVNLVAAPVPEQTR
jgi:hypothetical protein